MEFRVKGVEVFRVWDLGLLGSGSSPAGVSESFWELSRQRAPSYATKNLRKSLASNLTKQPNVHSKPPEELIKPTA